MTTKETVRTRNLPCARCSHFRLVVFEQLHKCLNKLIAHDLLANSRCELEK